MSTGAIIFLIIIAAGIAIWADLKWGPDSWMWQNDSWRRSKK